MTPYQYVYINIFGGKHINNSERFENDYWGVSTKKLISYIENNKSIFNKSKVKFAVCGIPDDVQIFYLKKIKNLDFKIVDINEEFDFVIMNNRVVWDKKNYTKTSKNAQTCFQKYSGEDIIKVQRRGLILSKITKI